MTELSEHIQIQANEDHDTSRILEQILRIQEYARNPARKNLRLDRGLPEADRALALSLAMICLFRKNGTNGKANDLEQALFPVIEKHNSTAQATNCVIQPVLSRALHHLHTYIETGSHIVEAQPRAVAAGMLTAWSHMHIMLALKQHKMPISKKNLDESRKLAKLFRSLDIEYSESQNHEATLCVRNPSLSRNGYIILRNSNTPGASRKLYHPTEPDVQNLFVAAFFAENLKIRNSATLFLQHGEKTALPASIQGEDSTDLGNRIIRQILKPDQKSVAISAKSQPIQHQDAIWQEKATLIGTEAPGSRSKDTGPIKPETPAESARKAKAMQKKEAECVYTNWKPALVLNWEENSKWKPTRHPAILAVPTALANLIPPPPRPAKIPAWILKNHVLSDSQLEAYLRAQHAFDSKPFSGQHFRNGFLLGDGTGTGKGRVVTALAAEAWSRGHRRSLWVSTTPRLWADSLRDWMAVGGNSKTFHRMKGDSKQSIHVGDGLMFCSYASLRTNQDNLLAWLSEADSPERDPFIAFDESQSLGNINSAQGAAAMNIQSNLRDARVLYTSSTPFRSPDALCYATRLGLWDRDASPFSCPEDMIESLGQAGIAGLEILQRELCEEGQALTRSLSVADIETFPVTLPCSDMTKHQHDTWSYAWQLVDAHVETGLIETNAEAASAIPRNQIKATRMAFFNHLICSAKGDGLIAAIEKDIDAGNAPVIQISSTMEAYASRRISEWKIEEGESLSGVTEIPEDFDLSPKKDICNTVYNYFPIHLMRPEPHPTTPGKMIAVPILDKNNNKIESPKAIVARNLAVEALKHHPVAPSLLDRLTEHFGDRLTEVTGRSMRVERRNGKRVMVSRTPEDSQKEVTEFLNGKREVLVFSAAGAHGRSYHSDRSFHNQKHRVHYLVQIAWAIDDVVQGLGRTHRTNQVTAPTLKVVTTDIPGEARFSSTACRKLAQLGALTRGDRRAQSNDSLQLNEHENLDTVHGRQAVRELMVKCTDDSPEAQPWRGFHAKRMQKLFGRLPPDNLGINVFLNNMMTMPFQDQVELMDSYQFLHKGIYQDMKARDLLDNGVEVLRSTKADTLTVLPLSRHVPDREPETQLRLIEFSSKFGFGYPQQDSLRLYSNIVEGVHGNRHFYRGRPSAFGRMWNDPFSSSALILEIPELAQQNNLLLLCPSGASMHDRAGVRSDGSFTEALTQSLFEHHSIMVASGPQWNYHPFGSSPPTPVNHALRNLQKAWNTREIGISNFHLNETQVLGVISGKILPVWKLVRSTIKGAETNSLTMRIRKVLIDSHDPAKRHWETGFVLPLGDAMDLWKMMKDERLI